MSSGSQLHELTSPTLPLVEAADARWYALQTRSRHEKKVAERLQEQGIEVFLPLVSQVHQWSDRRKQVEVPLFAGYVFVRLVFTPELYYRVCNVDGSCGFVGPRGGGASIPEEQIDAVRALVGHRVPWSNHPFLEVGQRVRIRGGSLDGVEGIFLSRNGDRTLVVSVDVIQRSMSVHIEGYQVEAI